MFRLLIAASGSKANATVVKHGERSVLVDCGLTYKALCETVDIGSIDAVFVTHSHSDHIKGLAVLRKHTDVPFYSAVDIDGCEKMISPMQIGGMTVSAFECSHDVPCVGYKFQADGRTLAIATDTGVVTDDMRECLVGCDTVMLECNHDPDMLRYGPYPQKLKSRIASNEGHLSNKDCAKTLTYLCTKGTCRAVLAHLSETNNMPLTAKKAVYDELGKYGLCDKLEVFVANSHTEIEV